MTGSKSASALRTNTLPLSRNEVRMTVKDAITRKHLTLVHSRKVTTLREAQFKIGINVAALERLKRLVS